MIGTLDELSTYVLLFCLNLRFKGVVVMVYIVVVVYIHYARGFLTVKVGKTKFRGLCLSPLSRTLCQLTKLIRNKKGGSFQFGAVPLSRVIAKKAATFKFPSLKMRNSFIF